jgi:carbonic anhydrase
VIGGTVLHNGESVRLSAVISHKPPPGEIWQSLGPVQLLDAAGNATGLILDAVLLNLYASCEAADVSSSRPGRLSSYRAGRQRTEARKLSATDDLLGSNASYAASFSKGDLPVPPAKQIAVVACMDARIETGALLGLEEGDAHVIRNAGGVVTDDVIRSLTISQRLLGTREIMLIHHTGCGMLTFAEDELKETIQKETGVRPPFAMETFTDLEENVRRSIARIHGSPFLVHKDAVRGFVYEVETGRLREVV